MTASRLDGLNALMTIIHAHAERGDRPPCVDPLRGHLWLSDDRDDQEAAAHGCSTCPALAACESYVIAFPEPAGVWAGRVRRNILRKDDR